MVVDNPPYNEGKKLLKNLVDNDVDCIYTLLQSVSYFLRKIDKVFVGASAFLANGSLISRAGTALVIYEIII